MSTHLIKCMIVFIEMWMCNFIIFHVIITILVKSNELTSMHLFFISYFYSLQDFFNNQHQMLKKCWKS